MPANRMSRFEPFIGVWNTTGQVLPTDAAPAGTLQATDTYAWLPGRYFIVHHVDARFDGQPARSMEILGYDVAAGRHVATSYDDHGACERFTVALDRRRWHIEGASQRFRGQFNVSLDRLTGLWELKGKRGRWQPWIELVLVRA